MRWSDCADEQAGLHLCCLHTLERTFSRDKAQFKTSIYHQDQYEWNQSKSFHNTCINYFDFGLVLYVPVNSYGHVRVVSSPYHTFSWASMTKCLTTTSCTFFFACNWQQPLGKRMAIEIFLRYSMGTGFNGSGDCWICSQTNICS